MTYSVTHNGVEVWHGSLSNCLRAVGVALMGPGYWRCATVALAMDSGYQLVRKG